MLGAILTVVVLSTSLATARHTVLVGGEAGSPGEQGFVTLDWVWADGTTTTSFTAYGPPEQVMHIDPRGRAPFCDGCELASSVHFEPGDEIGSD
ncbi:MAG TPA: hypothetical protein VM899_16255 [Rubellimicrobium sp.]|nr:hypothetical protein [Rubellimicrobium sp.]